ncbi:MAG: type II toxin-antitoxin system PemK/MazF family toxin [Alphaproteobacteria bacterium]|nr:type II toxin-antitoxin system PemK/MazF family toxin [Alphaproteobacteria bacterium]
MPTFKIWDVIKVPFPYTDRPVRQRRPALVVAADSLQEAHGLLWVVMITSAENRGWAGDVEVSDLAASGLPVPSVVRPTKIATIEARDAERIGSLPATNRVGVMERLQMVLDQATN